MAQQRIQTADRSDIHNASVNAEVAQSGLCGFTHLPTGRTCILSARHGGGCRFVSGPEVQVSGIGASIATWW